MPRGSSWDTTGTYSFEVSVDATGRVKDETHDIVCDEIQPLAQYIQEWDEIIIQFRAQGSYNPQTHWEPEDHSEDRWFESAYINRDHQKTPLPPELGQQLYDLYEDEIAQEDLPSDDSGPDYEATDEFEFRSRRNPFEQIQRIGETLTDDPDITN